MSAGVSPVPIIPPAAELPHTGTGARAPGWWGMLLLVITEVSLFAYFLVAWFYLRGVSVAVASEGGHAPALALPALLTVLLVSSSVVLRWGEVGIRRGDSRRLAIALVVTIVLGVAFLATQAYEYAHEQHMPQTDAYWSAFYTITGVHGAHVLVGVLMLSMNLVRTLLGHFTARRHLAVQNGAMYWHAVDLVWLILLVVLYLAPHFA